MAQLINSFLIKSTMWLFVTAYVLATIPMQASSLVTRDDFVCYDTTANYVSNNWNDIAINSSGRISQINIRTTPSGILTEDTFYEFNRFDKSGNQLQPVTIFVPDTTGDSVWLVIAKLDCYSNDIGETFIVAPVLLDTTPVGPGSSRNFIYLYDTSGQAVIDGKFIDCEKSYESSNEIVEMSFGAINNGGVVAVAWRTSMQAPPYDDSIYARLYYPDSDSLGPLLTPTALPQLIPHWRLNKSPRIGLADDNSFVAIWNRLANSVGP